MAARSHRSERSLGQQTQEGCSHSSAVRRMTDLDPERSAGGSQLEGQVQFVRMGMPCSPTAEIVGYRGFMCSCCFNSSRPQRLQSEATPLLESQRI